MRVLYSLLLLILPFTFNSPGRTVRDLHADATLSTLGNGMVSFNFDRDAFAVKYNSAGRQLRPGFYILKTSGGFRSPL